MTPDEDEDEDTYHTSRNYVDEAIRVERMREEMKRKMEQEELDWMRIT